MFKFEEVSAAQQLYFLFEDKLLETLENWSPSHDVYLLKINKMTKEGIEVYYKLSFKSNPSQIAYHTDLVYWDEI